MKRIISTTTAGFLLIGAVQTVAGDPDPAAVSDAPRIYRLSERSSYQTGCFEPCACPVSIAESIRGTFGLTPARPSAGSDVFDVRDVNWFVQVGGAVRRITGSGTYRLERTGTFARQRLELDLRTDDGPVEHFDSGLVPAVARFPRINVTISINGIYCLDTVIGLDAAPAPPEAVRRYAMVGGSRYYHGCFPPCMCPIVIMPVTGSFTLVEIGRTPLFDEYAVLDVAWRAFPLNPQPTSAGIRITGSGTYRIGGEVARTHQLRLDLRIDGGEVMRFDSGLVAGGARFPAIDIDISMNGRYCYDRAFDVRARPVSLSVGDRADAEAAGP